MSFFLSIDQDNQVHIPNSVLPLLKQFQDVFKEQMVFHLQGNKIIIYPTKWFKTNQYNGFWYPFMQKISLKIWYMRCWNRE